LATDDAVEYNPSERVIHQWCKGNLYDDPTYIPPVWIIPRPFACKRRFVKQNLLTRPEHLRSPSVFSGVRVTRSLVLCVCVVYRCLSFCTFYFGHRLTLCCLFFFDIRILITPLVSSNSSIYKIVRRSRTLAYFNTNLN
jgi:hypothetical protein